MPRKGTPVKAGEAETGSIKNLRLTEADKRKRTAAAKKQKNAANTSPQQTQRREMKAEQAPAREAATVDAQKTLPRLGANGGTPEARASNLPDLPMEEEEKPDETSRVPRSPCVKLMLDPPSRGDGMVVQMSGISEVTLTNTDEGPSGVSGILSDSEMPSSDGKSGDFAGNAGTVGRVDLTTADMVMAMQQLKVLLTKSRRETIQELQAMHDKQKVEWEAEASRKSGSSSGDDKSSAQAMARLQEIMTGLTTMEDDSAFIALDNLCREQDKMKHPTLSSAMIRAGRKAAEARRVAMCRERIRQKLEAYHHGHHNEASPKPTRRNSVGSDASATSIGAVSAFTETESPSMKPSEMIRVAQLNDSKLEYWAKRAFGLDLIM